MQKPKLTGEALQAAIDSMPGDRVTREDIEVRITDVHYYHPPQLPGTLTICVIELDNEFTVTGESACADPQNFSLDIGMALAYDSAFKKLWPLFGFLLSECRYQAKMLDVAQDVAQQAEDHAREQILGDEDLAAAMDGPDIA